jgi:hypothetical protein
MSGRNLKCLQDERTLPLELADGHTLKTLKLEGAYLLAQERAAAVFNRRVMNTKGKVTLSRDEAFELAWAFERVVSIASAYHLERCRPGDAA